MRVLRVLAACAAIVIAAASLGACSDETEGPETGADVEDVTQDDAVGDDAGLGDDEAAVFEDPESFVAQTVTVSGDVSDVISPSAFRISGGDVGGEGLLVFSAEQVPDLEGDEQTVRVTGTVRVVAQATFEDDFGFGWDDSFAEFEGEHAIAATSVEVIPATQSGDENDDE